MVLGLQLPSRCSGVWQITASRLVAFSAVPLAIDFEKPENYLSFIFSVCLPLLQCGDTKIRVIYERRSK